MTLTTEQAREFLGRPVYDAEGDQLGAVDGVYFNDATGELEWVSFPTDTVDSGQAFVPAQDLGPGQERVSLPFSRSLLDNLPNIAVRDGALSNAQVARLHEFFQTFDGRTRVTTASEGSPAPVPTGDATDPEHTPLSGHVHETAFGTGKPKPGEPHDVTLQGNGNPAP